MNTTNTTKIFLLLLYFIQISLCQEGPIYHRCNIDEEEIIPIPAKNFIPIEKPKRKLSNDDFKDFHIYLDLINIKKDIITFHLEEYENLFINSLTKVVETVQSLLKVKRLDKAYTYTDQEITNIKINDWNKTIIGSNAIGNSEELGIDLYVFGRLDDEMDIQTLASAGAKYTVEETGQPLVGVVNINTKVNYSKIHSEEYFQSIIMHEFTHILGFLNSHFNKYYHNVFNKTDEYGITRFYINSSKVVEVAKQYFNCSDIDGVELEEFGGTGTAGSHWEARILLGEYMNGVVYPEEQVISEFTLALLEDTGFYKANYFTGGLMRYGKNKGCEFIKNRCVNSSHEINPLFENEFYDSIKSDFIFDPSCSSGRQSRTYYVWWQYDDIPEYYKYFQNDKHGGYAPADYCPVAKEFYNETKDSYYTGHCSTKGNGGYGTQIYYFKDVEITINATHKIIKKELYYNTSEELESITGEKYSDHSFCYQSSLIRKDFDYPSDNIRAICYESFCSDFSLTIKINEDYIVCPRTGGKIEVEGYNGFFLCPDYNLICSGTVMCNDMFDCVEKESKIKENSYIYDYDIKTSQNIERALNSSSEITNYELAQNGKCPQNCKHCQENQKCIKCRDGYSLVASKNEEKIICLSQSELSKGYYLENELYYHCLEDCDICFDDTSCEFCVEGLDFSKGKCSIITEKCEKYDINGICMQCIDNFAFKEDDRIECLNKRNFRNNYYTKDNGISYHLCEKEISGCYSCYYDNVITNKVKCNLCNSTFALFEEGNICISKEQLNQTFFYLDETHINRCSNVIDNCHECNNSNICDRCNNDFYLINGNTSACVNVSNIEINEYYLNDNKTMYYLCNEYNIVKNCKECSSETNCTLCQEDYTFVNGVKSTCIKKEIIKYKYIRDPLDNSNFIKCDKKYENCDTCNDDQCIECMNEFVFINENYTNCVLKSSLDLEYYYTNDNINFYSCKEDKYKNSKECQSLISGEQENKPKYLNDDIYIIQVQIFNKKLVIYVLASVQMNNNLQLKFIIDLYKDNNNLRNLQDTNKKNYEIDLYFNGKGSNINPGDVFPLSSKEDFNDTDRIVIKELQDSEYGLKVVNNDKRLLDTEETKEMIKNKEILDFTNNPPSIKIFSITSASKGCNFELISKNLINVEEYNITLNFLEKNNINNIISAKCTLSVENKNKIPCALEEGINNDYILESYVGYIKDVVFYILPEADNFQLNCLNEENEEDKSNKDKYYIIGGVAAVIIVIIFIAVCCCGNKKTNEAVVNNNNSYSMKQINYQPNTGNANYNYFSNQPIGVVNENQFIDGNNSIKQINIQGNKYNENDYCSGVNANQMNDTGSKEESVDNSNAMRNVIVN